MAQTLSQTQIIQSLGEALAWFEKELNWGVLPAQLSHLTGRIGELYAAMITSGQMALKTNQHGYDVVSATKERISVKTITSSNHVKFRKSTLEFVDRIIVLKIRVDDETGVSIENLLDKPTAEALLDMRDAGDSWSFTTYASTKADLPLRNLQVTSSATWEDILIRRFEDGTIELRHGGEGGPVISPSKPKLREIAAAVGVDRFYAEDREKNTRLLGDHVIRTLQALPRSVTGAPVPVRSSLTIDPDAA